MNTVKKSYMALHQGGQKEKCKRKLIKALGVYTGAELEKERHAWVIKQLKELPPKTKILDAGAGEMRYRAFCKHLDYTSQDFGEYDGSSDGHAFHHKWDTSGVDIRCDICDMPFENSQFDAVLCTEVLEHVAQPELAVKELIRVLKPDGLLIITVPFTSYTHMSPYHFCTGFNIYWFQYVFDKYGVRLVDDSWYGNYFKCLSIDIWRTKQAAERYCNKKVNVFARLLMLMLNLYLIHFEKYDTGSAEFNRAGDRVIGRKKGES